MNVRGEIKFQNLLSVPFSPAKMQVILYKDHQVVLVSHREGSHLVLNVGFTGLEIYMC